MPRSRPGGSPRFNTLRGQLDLPPITDPDFQAAITEASAELTAEAISETFIAAACITALGLLAAAFIRSHTTTGDPMSTSTTDPTEKLEPPVSGSLRTMVMVMAVVLFGLLVGLAFLVMSLRDTRSELVQTRADLERVEQGAAGSAIVSAQVLDLTRQLAEIEPQISGGSEPGHHGTRCVRRVDA